MKKQYEDKVKIFTSLVGSLSILGANTAEAQTMLTRDISPDVVLTSSDSYALDIDNDGNVDFNVRGKTYTYNSVVNSFFYFRGTGYIGENPPTAGTSNAHTFVSQNSSDWYVDRLDVGDTTSFTTEYNDNPYTRLFRVANATLSDDFRWVAGTSDKYVGVQFTIGTEVHFGWVKMDVAADYSTITIKEVGWESSPGALGKAGATTSADVVTGLITADVDANNNASDIEVSFTKAINEANISGYRIVVVPTANIANATMKNIQLLPAANFVFVNKTGSNFSQTLPAGLLDFNGAPIVNGDYTVLVLTVGDNATGDALVSSGSQVITGTIEAKKITSNIYSEGNTIFIKDLPASGILKVINSTGAEVYNEPIASGSSSVQLSSTATGVYTIQITLDQLVANKKITIVK